MSKRDLEYLHDVMVKMDSRLDDVAVILAKQEVSLSEHIRRTEILEDEVRPLKKSINMAQGAVVLLSLIGIALSIWKAVH